MQKHGFSVLDQKYPFWENLVQNQNSHFKLKFFAYANSSMQESRWCSLFCFLPEIPILGKLGPKKPKIDSLSWNLIDYCNLSMQNSVVMFTFSVFIQKYLVCKIWVIHWCYSLFFVLTGHTFFGQIWLKKSKLSI